MKTKIIAIQPNRVSKELIKKAAQFLQKGELVAFPTETVYGLGANAFDARAVKKIYRAKGRPQDNPLIVHVAHQDELSDIVREIPPFAQKLMDTFWPGPLTIVMKKKRRVPSIVSGGLDSVAVRMPHHPIALKLIDAAGVPLVAPSANVSGRPSPTCTKHVLDDLNGKIACVIDGGQTEIGVESTVVDVTGSAPQILRPGKITAAQITRVVGPLARTPEKSVRPKAPGMKYTHYSPHAKVFVYHNAHEKRALIRKFEGSKVKVLSYATLPGMARSLFSDFREADREGYEIILVKGVCETGLGVAIMNRLGKASEK